MTKNKFILLVQKLREENIDINIINNLKSLSDEDIDLILLTNNQMFHKVLNMYLNKDFKELPIETKQQIIDKEIKSQDEIELKMEEYFANLFGSKEIKKELSQIVAQIKDEKTKEWANKMLLCSELLNNPNVKDIMLLISKIDNSDIIYWIYKIVTNKYLLSTEYLFDIISIITKIKNTVYAELVYSIVSNETLLKTYNNSILDIINIIINIKNPEIAFIVKLAVCNNNVMGFKDRLELIEIISKSSGVYQAEYTFKIITNIDILNSGLVISLAKLAINVSNNKLIQLPEKYTKKIMGRSINYKEGEPLFLVETNFWYLFEKSPEDAIELLTNENNNPDINENTNIKRLLKIKQAQRNK